MGADVQRAKKHAGQCRFGQSLFLRKEGHYYKDEDNHQHNPLKESEDCSSDAIQPSQADGLESFGKQVADQADQRHDQERNQ